MGYYHKIDFLKKSCIFAPKLLQKTSIFAPKLLQKESMFAPKLLQKILKLGLKNDRTLL